MESDLVPQKKPVIESTAIVGSATVLIPAFNNTVLMPPADISIDQARSLVLRAIPQAQLFFDYISKKPLSAYITVDCTPHPALVRSGLQSVENGPFVTFCSKDENRFHCDVISFSINQDKPSMVIHSREMSTGGATHLTSSELHSWFADDSNLQELCRYYDENLNRTLTEPIGKYKCAIAGYELVGFEPIYPYPFCVTPFVQKENAIFSLEIAISRNRTKAEFFPASVRQSFVTLPKDFHILQNPFNPTNDNLFALSPTELIIFHNSLTAQFNKAICLSCLFLGGSYALADTLSFAGFADDIGLYIRVLQACYRKYVTDSDHKVFESYARTYEINERTNASTIFGAELASLVPETLEELLTLTRLPEMKPFDIRQYPLFSIYSEQGSFLRRWPNDFLT